MTDADYHNLQLFAQAMFKIADWPNGGEIDEESLQHAAVDCGLLAEVSATQACSENCWCAEAGGKWPVICHRKTKLLTGNEDMP